MNCGCSKNNNQKKAKRPINIPPKAPPAQSKTSNETTAAGYSLAGFSWWQVLLLVGAIFAAINWGAGE